MKHINNKHVLFGVVIVGVLACIVFSCKKYKDPKGYDPNLPNHYCNDPAAVNYNWGFPGQPDNSICFYPTDVFAGTYILKDSVYADTLFIKADSLVLTFTKISQTKMTVSGFCANGNKITMTASPIYVATVDTLEGDSLTFNEGQTMCRIQDTVSGTITRDNYDSTLLHIALQVASDTGTATYYGNAVKQ